MHSASHLTVSDIDKIYVKAALYHGNDLIANKESAWVSPSNPRWSDVSEFSSFFSLYDCNRNEILILGLD